MTKNPPKTPFNVSVQDDSTNFRRLLGADWDRLHPDIQRRFCPENGHQAITYVGIMKVVFMSLAGRLLANFCRLLGTPLSYESGVDVPTTVKVYPNHSLGGMMWDRRYHFANGKTNRVRSTKCIQLETGLIEVALSGFGMVSNVYAQEGAIVFESKCFFFSLGRKKRAGIKVPIPHVLSPGKTIATQRALSDGQFEFTLDIRHSLLGQVFYQVGIFREESK